MSEETCYLSVDAGLTSTKVAAFDAVGRELHVLSAPMPRTYVDAHRHDVDMGALADSTARLLHSLAHTLAREGFRPAGIGVTAHGNGLYPVDASLRPVGRAIASSDSRAQYIVDTLPEENVARLAHRTGSIPWAGQPAILLRWLRDWEPDTYRSFRWALTCKDWITSQLTGDVSADYSDASACGLLDLDTLAYDPTPLEMLGLPSEDLSRFPPPRPSAEIVGQLSVPAAARTGLPAGIPVIAGCMDAVAAAIGVGARAPGDVTIIVGTFAINAVVATVHIPAPAVTLSALMPNPRLMLSMEVAPASATNLEWLARAYMPNDDQRPADHELLLREAGNVPAGAEGLLFLPFVSGAPQYPDASGTFLGISGRHRRGHLTRAVLEGVAQFHRVQLARVLASGATIEGRPWRLAGGGARSAVWAQIFADVLGRRLQRQLVGELGARGAASLVAEAVGHLPDGWVPVTGSELEAQPGPERSVYEDQAQIFDRCLAALSPVWSAVERYRTASVQSAH